MKRWILLSLLSLPLFAQTPVTIQADCVFAYSFTATGRQPGTSPIGFDNRFKGCEGWLVTMYVNGFSGVSLRLDSASDSAGSPGTWGAFSGTSATLTGCATSNPITATTQGCLTINGYNPWVSINLTSVSGSGTVAGMVFGCRADHCAALFAASSGGGPATNVNIADVAGNATVQGGPNGTLGVGGPVAAGSASTQNPVVEGGVDGSGNVRAPLIDSQGNQYSFLGCPSLVDVTLSGTAYNEIVAGTASQVIRVCKIFVTSSTGGNPNVNTITVATATVTTCGGPTELLNGAGITGIDSDFGGALRSALSASICVKETVGNSDHVTITYAKAAF